MGARVVGTNTPTVPFGASVWVAEGLERFRAVSSGRSLPCQDQTLSKPWMDFLPSQKLEGLSVGQFGSDCFESILLNYKWVKPRPSALV